MRTNIFFLALSLVFLSFSANAQREQTVLGKRNMGFSGIWGGSKHQLSRFGNTNNYVNAWHFGLEFGKALTIGWGRYDLNGSINWNNEPGQTFDINWHVMSLGYAFEAYKAVHPTISIDGGKGFVRYANEGKDRIWVIQPAAGIEINVFRWLHLGLEGGYRFVTNSDISLSDRQLSGAFGQVAFKFGFSWGRYRKSQHQHHD